MLSIAALAVFASFGLYLSIWGSSSPDRGAGGIVPQTLYASLNAAAVGPYGRPNSSYSINFNGINAQPYYVGSRPIVVYIGGDFCGLCAAARWPLVIALMRFGEFTNLHLMASSEKDQYPNVSSFSFYGGKYTSDYVVFEGYEVWNRNGQDQLTLPSNYTADWKQANQSIPFLTFGNQYIMRGIFSPSALYGRSWTDIVSLISSGTGVGRVIKEVANAISAAICAVDGGVPTEVCTNSAVSGFILIGRSAPGVINVSSLAGGSWISSISYSQRRKPTEVRHNIRTTLLS